MKRKGHTLTDKQRQFVAEYLVDLNATQAAIRAGYSKKTARRIASGLMQDPRVESAIQAAKEGRLERTRINADWLLRRLVDEAEADIADLYDKNTGVLLHPIKWPLIWRKGLVTGIKTGRVKNDDTDELVLVDEIKQSDRVKRLELIGKHIDIQAFRERIENEHTGSAIDALVELIKQNPGNNIREVVSRKLDGYDSGAD